MEFVLVLGLVGFLIWLVTRARQRRAVPHNSDTSPQTRSITRVPVRRAATSIQLPPEVAQLPGTDASAKERDSVSGGQWWIPPGQEITIGGHTIKGGMLYVGKGLSAVRGYGPEPALIDPSLPVSRGNPDHLGSGMTYWPSYSSIPPQCRAAYLEWLVSGRRDPNTYIGYVFLFFYGLERRALAEAPRLERAKKDLPSIMSEVEQLLQIYGSNGSFRGYATRFVDALRSATANGDAKPPMERTGYDLPISLRVGAGRIMAAGKSLPADWALSWYFTHPETVLRTPMRRCTNEFAELFRIRYAREFGDGMMLKPNRSKLKMSLTPASASFGGQVELSMDLPDIAALTAPLTKLRQIGERCAADLDAFSRWVGRNAAAPRTIGAIALLPSELAPAHDSEEARGLWDWIEKAVGPEERAVCSANDLLQHCTSFGEGKLAKSEAVLLAQLLGKRGYGIEPDVRFGGAPVTAGGAVAIFKLPPGAPTIASPEYASATVLLHLAVAVSAADGSISESERQHLESHVQRALALSDAERVRLSAHLVWLMKAAPSLAGLKKRLELLEVPQRSAIADFIIGVAGADGQISPEEIRILGKLYPMLGLVANDVYGRVHAMAAATQVGSSEPVTVIPAQPGTRFAIPPRPGSGQRVQLDMTAVKTKLAESAQISAILDDIFTEDEPIPVTTPTVLTASSGKIPTAYGILLSRLAERVEWNRAEFEALAAECRLLPDGAIDVLNEAAFEHLGVPVLEGDDPIQVDAATAKELLV